MMKPGVSLIELVVAVLIASMMAISLFQLITQTRRAVARISSVIEVDQHFIGFYNQIEKDVMGMFAPESSIQAYQEKDAKASKEKAQGVQGEQGAQRGQQPSLGQQGKNAAKKEVSNAGAGRRSLENIFYLDAQQDRFFWSFITTGAIQMLESDGTFQLLPSMRRVAYLLEKDPQRLSTYRLMYRFATDSLDVSAIKAADFYPSYELVSGITNFEIELTVFESEKKEKEAPKGKDSANAKPQSPKSERAGQKPSQVEGGAKKPQPAALKEWDEATIWEKYKTLIPAYVRLKGAVADRSGREYPFEFTIKVIAYHPATEMPPEKTLAQEIEELSQGIFGKGARR